MDSFFAQIYAGPLVMGVTMLVFLIAYNLEGDE